MLRPDGQGIERVYLHRAPVDMRRQIDGLSLVAKDVMQLDPMSGALFAFIVNDQPTTVFRRADFRCTLLPS